jgi:hypothetical protein
VWLSVKNALSNLEPGPLGRLTFASHNLSLIQRPFRPAIAGDERGYFENDSDPEAHVCKLR